MGVRVRVEIKYGGNSIKTSALVNSGYEVGEPEIHIPLALARKLGFKLEGLSSECYKVVGAEVNALIIGFVDVRVITEDKLSNWIRAKAVSVPGEYEVLLSDALTEALEIEVIKPKKGLWRFSGEDKYRESVESKSWIE